MRNGFMSSGASSTDPLSAATTSEGYRVRRSV